MSNNDYREPIGQPSQYEGPVWAKVVSNVDPTYMGGLEVQILREVGNDDDVSGQVIPVKYLSPFFGSTARKFVTEIEDYNNTQKSFGMWMVPPEVNSIVVCIFINGDYRKGYWIGCVLEENMNFAVPGHAATKYNVDGREERVPVAEYNKVVRGSTQDPTKILKVESPFSKTLDDQGLLRDDVRGITTSSARRETPSTVFGISTPGPVDKRSGAKRGKIGKLEHQIPNAFVSRLGGSSFVMDDGDDKFLRKKSPSKGPPEYAKVELKETDGDVTRPHNELVRIRTRTGHQILLHNSEDLIYIGNARGTAWIELTSDGKIDIFADDSINIRTKQDLNLYCDRDFNLEVGRNFNTKVKGEMHTNVLQDQINVVEGDQKIEIKNRVDETIGEQYRLHVKDHAKFVFSDDYTLGILGRLDLKVTKGTSVNLGIGQSVQYAPYDKLSHELDLEQKDVEGPNDDKVYIKIHQDAKIQYVNSNLDITVDKDQKLKVKGNQDVNVTGYVYTTSGGSNETKAGGNIIEVAPNIHMNGPPAATAATATTPLDARVSAKAVPLRVLVQHALPDIEVEDDNNNNGSNNSDTRIVRNITTLNTILKRVPTPEPYPHHENFDPESYKPEMTDRDSGGRYISIGTEPTETYTTPSNFNEYTISVDTFEKIKG